MYEGWETDSIDLFQERMVAFRGWMRQHGYRDKPLYITEYGTLAPYYDGSFDWDGSVFDEARARDFMYATFDYLLTASDPDLGYPADENRLVQRWLWYSLDDTRDYGGALFDPYTLNMMQLGRDFAAYTSAISPAVDLFAVDVGQVSPVPFSPTATVTVTLQARVANVGNVACGQPVTVRFMDDGGGQIGSDQVISEMIAGCAGVKEAFVVWPNVTPGIHTVRVVVDPENAVSEGNEGNNQAQGLVLVAEHRVLFPLVLK